MASIRRSGALLQPSFDFPLSGFSRGDALHHRHVDVGVRIEDGLVVCCEETLQRQERRALVPVRQRMVRASRSTRTAAFSMSVGKAS
jgi:hypothetical protein